MLLLASNDRKLSLFHKSLEERELREKKRELREREPLPSAASEHSVIAHFICQSPVPNCTMVFKDTFKFQPMREPANISKHHSGS